MTAFLKLNASISQYDKQHYSQLVENVMIQQTQKPMISAYII